MIGKISKTENAIKVDGETGIVRLMVDIIQGDDDLVAFLIELIGEEFEITINGHDDTQTPRKRYFG